MTMPSETFFAALEQFSSTEPEVRNEGFTRLVARSRPYLHSLLAPSLPSESDRDDVIQEIFHRVWKSRERLQFPSTGAWWRFLRTLAHNCTIDHLRSVDGAVPLEDPEWQEVSSAEAEQIDLVVEAMEDKRALYKLADETFLGIPSDVPQRVRTRQLLASKLLLVDKLHWKTVCRIVNSSANDDEKIDREKLNRLLTNGSLLRQLAYSELHWSNERLTAFLIEMGNRGRSSSSNDPTPWTEDEILAVQLRFLYVMLFEQIAHRMDPKFKKSELIQIFDSCVSQFPFIEIMNRLLRSVGQFTDAQSEFGAVGLWNRLVFQYFCHNGLTHRDIYDRTAAAAKAAGYDLTLGKLNVGLSNGRLFKKLAEQLAQKGK
jgi:DNA-directed RNA polymerase specialized sigma24 family protein